MKDLLKNLATLAKERCLQFLLIGGHAVILMGVPRFTRDVDLLIPDFQKKEWEEILKKLGYTKIHQTDAFVQFVHASITDAPPVDFMVVDRSTWEKLHKEAICYKVEGDLELPLPAAVHLVAMKLHALSSQYRPKENSDWSDILNIIKLQKLSLNDEQFIKIIKRYGSDQTFQRLKRDLGYEQ